MIYAACETRKRWQIDFLQHFLFIYGLLIWNEWMKTKRKLQMRWLEACFRCNQGKCLVGLARFGQSKHIYLQSVPSACQSSSSSEWQTDTQTERTLFPWKRTVETFGQKHFSTETIHPADRLRRKYLQKAITHSLALSWPPVFKFMKINEPISSLSSRTEPRRADSVAWNIDRYRSPMIDDGQEPTAIQISDRSVGRS